ncbi:MAG TPA: hypothetical protein ENH63_06460 [Sulfitobacter litoralis]|jgi:hypothetical protein|uniref:Uncharacterized protein n=2 Tax=root TaxID=1 RepID=A0A7V1FM92_9RHOB|nr:hypothetical protein [Sulfitobacter litoralis]HDZ51421.1 hypothetical protein [Sulfitobacter litoralis]
MEQLITAVRESLMSSGLECDIVGLTDGRWFYILENPGASKNAFDWRADDPSVGGPFGSEEAAMKGLMRKHQNPGGYNSYEITVEEAIADPILKKNLEKALGRDLEFPPLPDAPVEIGAILYGSYQIRTPHGSILRFSGNEDGSAMVKCTESFSQSAKVLGTGGISARRDAAGIVVAIQGDLPDEVLPALKEIASARGGQVYPGEMMVIQKLLPPEDDLSPEM